MSLPTQHAQGTRSGRAWKPAGKVRVYFKRAGYSTNKDSDWGHYVKKAPKEKARPSRETLLEHDRFCQHCGFRWPAFSCKVYDFQNYQNRCYMTSRQEACLRMSSRRE